MSQLQPRTRRFLPIVIALLLVAPGSYFGVLKLAGNFHAVIAGELYRSAQPSGSDITDYARTYGIRSVLNLRGSHAGEAWYDEERAASTALGIDHIDLPLSADHELSDSQIETLAQAMATAPKPLLIHCKSGADRTGLAAALYLLRVRHLPPHEAGEQLSWIYGHLPIFGNRTAAMDETFEHAWVSPARLATFH
jgi:protein tyrosine/serine phosphatase